MKKIKVIFGVVLTVTLVATLALGAIPAAAGTLAWGYVSTPQATYQQLQAGTDVNFLVAAPDDVTLFAYDNAGAGVLYKSSDAGVTWTTTNIGTTLEGNVVTAMAVSPNYATDLTVVAATAGVVYRSQNGGATFGAVSTAQLTTASGAGANGVAITSIDIAQYYTGGELAILAGTADAQAAQFGGAFLCRLDTWTWTDLTVGNAAAGTGAAGGVYDVMAVAFSPNHTADAQLLAVGSTAAATVLTTKFAANTWNNDVVDANIGAIAGQGEAANDILHAVIAFADDYEWSSNNRVLVGVESNHATLDDVYRVHGGLAGGASVAYDLNVNGTTVESEVWSIAVSGGITGATVIVGQANSLNVKRTADPTLSTVTWSSATKAPVGTAAAANAIVLVPSDFATSNKVMVGTNGNDSNFSVSNDGGAIFNGIALIDVSAIGALTYQDLAMVDANTMFLLIHDDVGGTGAIAIGDLQMVFKTTDGGATWTMVLHKRATVAVQGLANVEVSPNYATDSTLYVAETGTTRLWKSTNSGDSYIGLAAPANITALAVVDGSTYFTGHAALVYKSGHWNSGAITADAVSIAVSPDFATDDTVIVGNDDGDVYVSVNASATASVLYTRQGVDDALANGATVVVAPHPDFATNSIIFAGSSTAGTGVQRTTVGSGVWTAIDAATASAALALSPDGSLYSANPAAAGAVRRSIDPEKTVTAATCIFENMATAIPGTSVMQSLDYQPGSNVLYALVGAITPLPTAYPHGFSLITYTDTFAVTPTLVSPADGAADVGATVDFTWEAIEAPAGRAVTYTLVTATDAAFSAATVQSAAITGTTFRVAGLTAGRQYWWSISCAVVSPLRTRSATGSFVVALTAAAQSAALSSPAPGASGVSVTPNLQWGPVAGATGYRVQLATDAGFTNILANKLLDTTVWSYGDALENSTTYYWRVKAISPDTEGGWSVGVFTTAAAAAAPAPPVTVTQQPPAPVPTITVPAPPAPTTVTVSVPPAQTITVPPTQVTEVTPAWIIAIVVVGAVLMIAVIVLIVRTRRAI